jgi:hypothetical protein
VRVASLGNSAGGTIRDEKDFPIVRKKRDAGEAGDLLQGASRRKPDEKRRGESESYITPNAKSARP